MAKKRVPQKRKSTSAKTKTTKALQKKEPVDWMWRFLIILLIITFVAVMLYYLCRPQVKQTLTTLADKTEVVVLNKIKGDKPENKSVVAEKFETVTYTNLEIPKWESSVSQQQIKNLGYTSSYNTTIGMPNWVAYELTRAEAAANEAKRKNKFMADPKVKGKSTQNKDYKNSGYDKGHMAPAADMKWNQMVMDQSFYFTNICPQAPGLNRGAWKDLEEEIRQWAIRDSAITIICGPLFTTQPIKYIPNTQVAIPDAYFKVVCAPYVETPRGLAFIFPNANTSKHPREYVVTINSVEQITGMDFLWQLPDKIEDKIEQTSNYANWE